MGREIISNRLWGLKGFQDVLREDIEENDKTNLSAFPEKCLSCLLKNFGDGKRISLAAVSAYYFLFFPSWT